MKGVIVDKKGRYAVMLTTEGSFVKIANKTDYKIGSEVELSQRTRPNTSMMARISSIAAVFLFALGMSYGVYCYTSPFSYVDLDINPSIGLSVNAFNLIISTEAYNADGEKLLGKENFKFKSLDAGLTDLLDSAVAQGYLKSGTDNAILLTVSSGDAKKAEKLAKKLETVAGKALDEKKIQSDIISQEISAKKHTEAKKPSISPGKLKLIEKLMQNEPGLLLEDLIDAPVKDIMKKIKESEQKGSLKDKGKESDGSMEKGQQTKQEDTKQGDTKQNDKSDSKTEKKFEHDKGGKPGVKQDETKGIKKKDIDEQSNNKENKDREHGLINNTNKSEVPKQPDEETTESGLVSEKDVYESESTVSIDIDNAGADNNSGNTVDNNSEDSSDSGETGDNMNNGDNKDKKDKKGQQRQY